MREANKLWKIYRQFTIIFRTLSLLLRAISPVKWVLLQAFRTQKAMITSSIHQICFKLLKIITFCTQNGSHGTQFSAIQVSTSVTMLWKLCQYNGHNLEKRIIYDHKPVRGVVEFERTGIFLTHLGWSSGGEKMKKIFTFKYSFLLLKQVFFSFSELMANDGSHSNFIVNLLLIFQFCLRT